MIWWKYGRGVYLDEFERCATADCKYLFPKFSDDLQCNSRIIYQDRPEFSDYAGKEITGSISGATAVDDSCLKTTAKGKLDYIMFL